MDRRENKPRTSPTAPDLSQPLEVLRTLLKIEWERLEVAQRIECERNIVFPETTVIIRDIQKLMRAINADQESPPPDVESPEPEDDFNFKMDT